MRITILSGSPNRKGSTNMLAEEFKRGAEEAGHKCEVIDVCHANIHPCTGCVRYINFEDKGMVLGYGCGTPPMTKRSGCPEKAYRHGKSL